MQPILLETLGTSVAGQQQGVVKALVRLSTKVSV